jgi:tetratricopeptide (TPR) repeat protein
MQRGKLLILLLVLLTFPAIQNCGGGGGGGGATGGDLIVAEQLINDGWSNIGVGNYQTAQNNFQQALGTSLNDAQRVNANNGLGWALSKNGKILEAIPYFEIAADKENEAKVGLAGALVYRHQTASDYVRAAELLGNMPPEKFSATHAGLSLSSAKVHAMAAIAYALAGDKTNAKTYINKAAALDSNMVGTSVDKIDEAFQMLGWKD